MLHTPMCFAAPMARAASTAGWVPAGRRVAAFRKPQRCCAGARTTWCIGCMAIRVDAAGHQSDVCRRFQPEYQKMAYDASPTLAEHQPRTREQAALDIAVKALKRISQRRGDPKFEADLALSRIKAALFEIE